MVVPAQFGQKEKFIQVLDSDPLDDKSIQISLPQMSYALMGMRYGSKRKQQTTLTNFSNVNGSLNTQYVPVPYDFDYELYIYVRNIEDGTQIIEQILPFFTPDYTMKIMHSPSLGISKDVPVIINDVSYEVDNKGAHDGETRKVIWTIKFTVLGWLFGPAKIDTHGIIKEVFTNLYDTSIITGKNINLVMDLNSGNGTFMQGETVYQGNTIHTAVATATVIDWSLDTGKLYITDATGLFESNQLVYGTQTNASFLPINYEIT